MCLGHSLKMLLEYSVKFLEQWGHKCGSNKSLNLALHICYASRFRVQNLHFSYFIVISI